MHCFKMEAGAIRALHSLTATALCQIDQMKAASLPERRGPNLETIEIYSCPEVILATCPLPGWRLGFY